jgi:hypothetical protein
MTALEKYARLEGPGVWKADPDAQRRDVVAKLGDATLMIADSRSDTMLSHWSLPAVQRLNRGSSPAVYAPGPDATGETIEIDDPTLIEALETIRAALAPKPPLRRVRLALAGLAVIATVAAFTWVPSLLVDHTAGIVPPAMRTQIGRAALDGLFRPPDNERLCTNPFGRQALTSLRGQVLGNNWRISVVAGVDGFETAHLPGRLIVVGDDLLRRLDSAEALAGWLLAERQAALADDPLRDALRFAGVRATLALLTTGSLPQGALDGYAALRFAEPAPRPDAQALAAELAALGVGPAAYALSLPTEDSALAQAMADQPPDPGTGRRQLLSDGQWLTLQAICDP